MHWKSPVRSRSEVHRWRERVGWKWGRVVEWGMKETCYRVQSSWWTTSQAHSTARLGCISISAVRSVQFPPGDFNLRVKELPSRDTSALIKWRCAAAFKGTYFPQHNCFFSSCFLVLSLISPCKKSCVQARKHSKSHTHRSVVPFCDGLHVLLRIQTEQ